MNLRLTTASKVLFWTSSLLLGTFMVVPTWARPSGSRLSPFIPSPTPQITGAVGNTLSSATFVNLYWDASWDADNPTMPKAALDTFTAAMLSSSYFGGMAEYGVGHASFGGGFLPVASCPQKAPSMVGFYDPINASIIGFLNCELQHGGLPSGPQVVYNIILPAGSLESDLFGNRTLCSSSSPAVAWHFHQTPYSAQAAVGIAAAGLGAATGGVPGALEAFLGVLAALQGGPLYTIESANPTCGSFTDNLLHEMVETASDPFPSLSVSSSGNGEIADICAGSRASSSFVPPQSSIFSTSATFTTPAIVSVPQYWSNAGQRCVTGFTNTTIPTPSGVTFTNGSYPINPGSYSFTITGHGFGTLPAAASLAASPYIELQNDTRRSRIGNSLNGDSAGLQIASWTDTSITVTGASGGDSYSFWICNPTSGLCAWGSMPPAVYAVSPNGAALCPGGQPVTGTITGANFYGVQGVNLDGLQSLSFTRQSISQITSTIPILIGSHTITVNAFGGSSVAAGPLFVDSPPLSATATAQPAAGDLVTVKGCGTPLGGATVTSNQGFTAVTNTSGQVVVPVYRGLCYAPGSVPKVGGTTVPTRTPIPCPAHTATISEAGYQLTTIGLP